MQAVARYPAAKSSQRLAFVYYLRTGRRVSAAAFVVQSLPHGLKFNPNHDPHNGQFTFGPGGGSLGGEGRDAAVDRPDATPIGFQRVQFNRPPPAAGGNSRAFQDPMLLEQVFPGHADSPAGSILAVADDFLDLTGPEFG